MAIAEAEIGTTHPHVAKAFEYIEQVVNGEIPACKWTRLACERQIADLEREETDPTWPYRFDWDAAEKVCIFVELMPHIKGPLANRKENIRLEPWQCFVLTTVFGWVHKGSAEEKFLCEIPECKHVPNVRRFNEAYVEVPRGNGKSSLLAPVSLYMMAVDGEQGAECYSVATKRDQAKVVFEIGRQMTMKTPEFRNRYGVEAFKNSVYQANSASKFMPLSAEFDTLDGLNVYSVSIDELHAHKNAGIYNVMKTGTLKREQALLFSITTAGFNRAGICYQVRGYILRILEGRVAATDPGAARTFGIVYTIDDGDDYWNPLVWRKANPNWDASIDQAGFAAAAYKAKEQASQLNNFLTKHLDVWVNAERAWMDMPAWMRQADPSLDLEQFIGSTAYDGVDLASRIDLAAKAIIFPRYDHCAEKTKTRTIIDEDGNEQEIQVEVPCLTIFIRAYAPALALQKSPNADTYQGWQYGERLVVTAGNTIDFETVEQDILEDMKFFDLRELAVDPHNATYLSTRLMTKGVTVFEVMPSVANYSEPMKELLAMTLDGRIHHDGDPVLEWAVANVVERMDQRDNVYPIKANDDAKIDPVIAVISAMRRWMAWEEEGNSVYKSRGIISIGG